MLTPDILVEAYVLTYNEQSRIEACLRSLAMAEVDVVSVLDGGSTDQTIAIATKLYPVTLLSGTSISQRRDFALKSSRADFVMFLDADQRLPEGTDVRAIIRRYFRDRTVAGVQFSLGDFATASNYWERGFQARHRVLSGTPGPRRVIGTPCIWRTSALAQVGYDPSLTGPNDDTTLGWQLSEAGYKLLRIPDSAHEEVRASAIQTLRKSFWYGLGDAEFIRRYPQYRQPHLFHVLLRVPFAHTKAVGRRSLALVPFSVVFGTSRAFGLLWGLIHRADMTSTSS